MANIDHLGIAVRSIEQAQRLYQALGLTVLKEEEEDEGVRSVMIPLGDSRLRLLEPLDKTTSVARFLEQHGEGVHHVALHVDDISGAFEEMKQAGYRLLSDEIEIGAGGRLAFSGRPIRCQRRVAGNLPGSYFRGLKGPMLLSLNTCGNTASVALGVADENEVRIVATAELAVRTYSARLIPEIASLLQSQNATLRDIEAIVVVKGPGSFTGIRVGLSTAKGLAEGAGIPLIALSRLALLANASGLPHVLAAVDAGRGEYYVGEYRNGNSLGEMLLSGEETVAAAKQPGAGVLVCDESRADDASASACSALAICGPVYVQPPDAAEALRFSLGRFRAGDFDDLETLDANYLRRSDAEVLRAARVGA